MDINLSVLQRQDPKITKILDSATQVAVYAFNSSTSQWEKTESEGALFICARSNQPSYVLMIMNRLNRDNYMEPIVPDLDLCPNNQYLLYKYKDRIRCIWFYNLADCAKIGGLIQKLLESYSIPVKPSVEPKISPIQQSQTSATGVPGKAPDIVSMLNRAQHQYDQNVQKTRHKSVNEEIAAPLTALLRTNNTTAAPAPNITPSPGNFSFDRITQSSFSVSNDSNNTVPQILQRLLSQPASLDGLVVPQPIQLPQTPAATNLSALNVSADMSNTTSSNFSRLSISDTPLVQSETIQLSPNQGNISANRLVLLTPADLSDGFNNDGMTPLKSSSDSFGLWETSSAALNEEQFQQAFVYLLQNDANFLSKLHGAYLKSFEQRTLKR